MKEEKVRHGCTYKPDCDHEATTTVVINGQGRAVCEQCRREELRRQSEERERDELQARSRHHNEG